MVPFISSTVRLGSIAGSSILGRVVWRRYVRFRPEADASRQSPMKSSTTMTYSQENLPPQLPRESYQKAGYSESLHSAFSKFGDIDPRMFLLVERYPIILPPLMIMGGLDENSLNGESELNLFPRVENSFQIE